MAAKLSSDDRLKMGGLSAGHATKSAKIRALHGAGYSKSRIAEFLGISYQFVYNVLARQGERVPLKEAAVDVGPGGRIVIPAPFRQALGLGEGDQVLLSLVGDEVHLASRRSKIRQAQDLLAKYVPSSVDLAAELIAERRQEAAEDDGASGGRG